VRTEGRRPDRGTEGRRSEGGSQSQGSKNVVLMKNNKLDESFISGMRDEE
jgi:hypothetical protein